MELVKKLRTRTDEDREKLDKLMQELIAAHARGEISELLFAYIDNTGTSNYAVSGSMKLSNFSYLIACFQWKLNKWMDD